MNHESFKIFSYPISPEKTDERLDTFLAASVKELSRSRVQELIRNGLVKVNGRFSKRSYRLKKGDRISVVIPPPRPCHLEPEQIYFTTIHEDSSIIVLNKPPGLVVHPAPGHPTGTLVHGLIQRCGDLSGIGGVLRPGIVHRLDKDTSGVMVVAKNDHVHTFLSRQFKAGTVKKRYMALAHGIIQGNEGVIDLPIARHPKRRKEMSVSPSGGKRAITLWEKITEFGGTFSYIAVTLKTGRTHQIRVHLSHIGHPVVGDPVYGYKRNWRGRHLPLTAQTLPKINRQMLHAEILGFIHPDSGNYTEFQAPLPDDMSDLLEVLKLIVTF